jgi:hypothetical protein
MRDASGHARGIGKFLVSPREIPPPAPAGRSPPTRLPTPRVSTIRNRRQRESFERVIDGEDGVITSWKPQARPFRSWPSNADSGDSAATARACN